MMTTETIMQKRNLDSSILFIQQEHAAILKGLHEEIAMLQKRCTDLTFQLTMNGLSIDEPDAVDVKMQGVQKELEASRTKITTLEKELTDRDKRVERLEVEARSQRKRWLDESRAQSQTVNNLKAELEAKANNIAYLTTELHRLKHKGKIEQGGNSSETLPTGHSMAAGATSQPGYLHPDSKQGTGTKGSFIPAPPTREKTLGVASSRLRRSGHRSVMTGGVAGKGLATVHPSSADALLPRNSNTLRLSSGRSSGSESPDITPFLAPKEEFVQVVGGKSAPILPPIAATAAALGSGAHPVLVHQVVSSSSQHRQKTKSTAAADTAIVKLAVENAVPDHAWSMAHESQSSEFK